MEPSTSNAGNKEAERSPSYVQSPDSYDEVWGTGEKKEGNKWGLVDPHFRDDREPYQGPDSQPVDLKKIDWDKITVGDCQKMRKEYWRGRGGLPEERVATPDLTETQKAKREARKKHFQLEKDTYDPEKRSSCDWPSIPSDTPEKSVRLYQEELERHLEQFVDNELVFVPDFERSDGRRHYRYCSVKGMPDHVPDHVYRPYVEGTKPVIMNQDWSPKNHKGERNPRYEFQKNCLKEFVEAHMSKCVIIRDFARLMHKMMGWKEIHYLRGLYRFYQFKAKEIGEKATMELFVNVVRWALRAEELLPERIYMFAGEVESATFSHEQCAALVSRMFFSRNPRLNFQEIMHNEEPIYIEKLKFIFTYFEKMSSPNAPKGVVSFRRIVRTSESIANMWDWKMANPLPRVRIVDGMIIEETALCTQVDFANKHLGGGVLGRGSVQEEIRFLMCPEMMVGMMLLLKPMHPYESFSIVGARVFSSYSGYSYNLKWQPLEAKHSMQNAFRDKYDRLMIETIAIDAQPYEGDPFVATYRQAKPEAIRREVYKAIVGFGSQRNNFNNIPVVSGWWGCGAFGGNKQFKFLIQVIAAGYCNRPLDFCPFGEKEVANQCRAIMRILREERVNTGDLYNMLRTINKVRHDRPFDLFNFIDNRLRLQEHVNYYRRNPIMRIGGPSLIRRSQQNDGSEEPKTKERREEEKEEKEGEKRQSEEKHDEEEKMIDE